jgi:hypothetical protein
MSMIEDCESGTSIRIDGARIGQLLGIDEAGSPVVDFDGNPYGPAAARLAIPYLADLAGFVGSPTALVLVFEEADPARPIVVGMFPDTRAGAGRPGEAPAARGDLVLGGDRVRIEARDEVSVRCGEASLTMRRDGKILVKGSDVTSRATRVHKIKGGSVRIN